jgi:hypothetical protein
MYEFDLVLRIGSKHDLLLGPIEELPQLDKAGEQTFSLAPLPAENHHPIQKAVILHLQSPEAYLLLFSPDMSI